MLILLFVLLSDYLIQHPYLIHHNILQFHEERQMAWDQREVELERQLDKYEQRQNDILSTAQKVPMLILFDIGFRFGPVSVITETARFPALCLFCSLMKLWDPFWILTCHFHISLTKL